MFLQGTERRDTMTEQVEKILNKFATVLPQMEQEELVRIEACADTLCLMREKKEETKVKEEEEVYEHENCKIC